MPALRRIYKSRFSQAGITPRFEFGFGQSFTTFDYSNLKVSGSTTGGTRQPLGPGSSLDPWYVIGSLISGTKH